ncbi:MarR family winged helix-turn-helix transcriptional regulator [Kribbella sp. NPDC056861]|uniref:MarR family winged helix-turn-helix transcriptional regulator n=1 Tax=Kribbella sp. NPDC056861 TaxID=3154857 RepID=UPI00343E5768
MIEGKCWGEMADMSEDATHGVPAEIAELDPATDAVRALIDASQDLAGRMARVMGMNASDMRAILLLSENEALGASDLADRLGLAMASTTALVDRLERAGHVKRVRDSVDRRRVTITGTTAARIAVLTAWVPAIQTIDEVCQSLTDTERQFALDLLGRLTTAIQAGGRS